MNKKNRKNLGGSKWQCYLKNGFTPLWAMMGGAVNKLPP
jgi:hypothetical protein